MVQVRVRPVLALVVAVLFAAPALVVAGASSSSLPERGVASSFTTGVGILDAAIDPRSILAGAPGILEDDPGAPYGFPDDDTLGFTTDAGVMDVWRWDYEGPLDVDVDMGKLVKKKDIGSEQDYILEVYFDLVGWFWNDGDGVFDPAPGNGNGGGDDPCPEEPFKLITVYVNGAKIRTLEGHNTQPCAPGGPEVSRSFEIVPVGNDLPNQVRVPKARVQEGVNTVRIEVHDFVTGPPNNPFHTEFNDGFEIYLHALALELAAPPLVLSHGWDSSWDPATGTTPWQPVFKANIQSEFVAHTGQNPWRWASQAGKDGILLNFYDNKQDFRKSSRELRANVQSFHSGLGFSGKGWMHGHSMGGLVSRYYLEVLGGNAKIEKFAQTGTPNLGSWEANVYTLRYYQRYEAVDEDLTAEYYWTLPGWPFDCCVKVFSGWRDWWSPSVLAFQWVDGPGHGRDHLADFMIKPVGANPPLAALNGAFPASGVEYFTVRGDCSVLTDKKCIASGYQWRGDGAVGLDSATMNNAIRHRTVDEFHEKIPAHPDTARWMARYWGGLDIDNGMPLSLAGVAAQASFFPSRLEDAALHEVPRAQTGAADLLVRPTDVVDGPYEHAIVVDATPRADFVVYAAPVEGPIEVTLAAPDGTLYGTDSAAYDVTTGAFLRTYRYTIEAPTPGTWTLGILPGDVPPAEGVSLHATAFLPGSPIELVAGTAERYLPGETAMLVATLTNGGAPLSGANVVATSHDEMGAEIGIPLAEGPLGTYTGAVAAGDADGSTTYAILAEGEHEGVAYERAASVDVIVARVADLSVSALAGEPVGAWGGDAVTLRATVGSEGERALEGGAVVQFFDGDPGAGGTLLGSVALDGALDIGATRLVELATVAPTHEMTLFVRVDSIDLEEDLADNVAIAPMPFVRSPRTAATITGEAGENGWLLGPATVALAPFDGSASVGATVYRLDGGAPSAYAGAFEVATEGAHTLEFWTTDGAGNVEPVRTATFGVDLAAPVATLLNPAPGFVHVLDQRAANPQGVTLVAGPVDVQVQATDAGSGIARVRLFVDGEEVEAASAAGTDDVWHATWDTTGASVGDHTLAWRVEDAAGRAVEGELRVYVAAGRAVDVERDPYALVNRLIPGGA